MTTQDKNKGGRPLFEPTPEQRKRVLTMVGVGISHAEICLVVTHNGKPLSLKTLRKHFREELNTGTVIANAQVGGAIFKAALEGKPGAQALWAKCRMGWKETQAIEHSGPAGSPMQVEDVSDAKDRLLAKLLPDAAEE